MTHPFLIRAEIEARYQQLLAEAATERRYRQIRSNRPSFRQRLGHFLIVAGQTVKAQSKAPSQAKVATPPFGLSSGKSS